MNRKQKKLLEQTIRCAIYTRKSTEEGLEQEFNSLDAQRASGEAYIASQKHEGWVCLPEVYDDGGFSGGSMVSPALTFAWGHRPFHRRWLRSFSERLGPRRFFPSIDRATQPRFFL